MSVECEMLGALLSERRRGELPAEQARALELHLAGCARCREEARSLESVLAAVELPPVGPAELEALRTRRIAELLRRLRGPGHAGWRLPAVLVAAAAAAVLTVSVRPVPHRQPGAGRDRGRPTPRRRSRPATRRSCSRRWAPSRPTSR